ncbi:hypothetical protein G6L37_00990 [Agrobacterium rubi]|nr:hypothetical protein [Agrobacterium rubi]NTF23967.1 hypothetical protein [Agrobacterium rubi]
MEHGLIADAQPGAHYPDDLDITVYDDGRWHYAASFPDEFGSYREAYLSPTRADGWSVLIFDHVATREIQGETAARWEAGLLVDNDDGKWIGYEQARGSAETWLRGGRIFGVA